jgi:AcrR family transcriptional regulator
MTFSVEAPEALAARPLRLVASARDLANESGSAAFTVAQVTDRSGLSLKAFYQCFKGKDELLLALLAEDSKIGADFLASRIGARTGDDAVHAYVTELFAMLSLPGASGYAGVLVREYLRLVELHGEELDHALRPLTSLLRRHLGTADPARDARTMFSVLLRGIHEVVVGNATNADELAEYLYRFCTYGMGR